MDKILVVCAARAERGTLRLRLFSARAFYAYGFTKILNRHASQCILHTASLHTVKISSGIISQEPMRSSRSSTGHCALWSDTLL